LSRHRPVHLGGAAYTLQAWWSSLKPYHAESGIARPRASR
jgi:hypothetical protein